MLSNYPALLSLLPSALQGLWSLSKWNPQEGNPTTAKLRPAAIPIYPLDGSWNGYSTPEARSNPTLAEAAGKHPKQQVYFSEEPFQISSAFPRCKGFPPTTTGETAQPHTAAHSLGQATQHSPFPSARTLTSPPHHGDSEWTPLMHGYSPSGCPHWATTSFLPGAQPLQKQTRSSPLPWPV